MKVAPFIVLLFSNVCAANIDNVAANVGDPASRGRFAATVTGADIGLCGIYGCSI
jgi:hypothetical protein